jgi:hypothetical protein
MVSAKECDRSQILYGSRRLLQKVHYRVLEVRTPYHFLGKEGEEVSVDIRL